MSKKVKIQVLNSSGVQLGQKARSGDIMDLQNFAHSHLETITKDFLCNARKTIGFNYTLGGGNTRQMTIQTVGRVYDENGLQYDLPQNTTVTFAASNSQPRIDLVVATINNDVEAEQETIPFVRIRTQSELEAGTPPYVPVQSSQYTQLHNVASIRIVAGTPNASPVAPTPQANEIVLYSVAIAANSTQVLSGDVTDLRPTISNLQTFQPLSEKNQANGYAGLDSNGRIQLSQIPAIKSHEFYTVANQAARLALTTSQVQLGDEAFQTDTGETFKLIDTDPSNNANWKLVADVTPDWSVIANKPSSFDPAIGNNVTGGTEGSILFVGASGVLAQDNTKLFFDNTNDRLGINTITPRRRIDVLDTTNPQLRLTHTDNDKYTDLRTDGDGKLQISPTSQIAVVNGELNIARTGNDVGALKVTFTTTQADNWVYKPTMLLDLISANEQNLGLTGLKINVPLCHHPTGILVNVLAQTVPNPGGTGMHINCNGISDFNHHDLGVKGISINTDGAGIIMVGNPVNGLVIHRNNDANPTGHSILMKRSRGVFATETVVATNDILGSILTQMWNTGSPQAYVNATKIETIADAADSAYLGFHTKPTGNPMREALRIASGGAAGETSLYLLDITAGTLKRVSIGAADSGGAGYKLLRVAN